MVQAAILSLEGVTKQFSQSLPPAVAEVTLTLQKGDLLGLLGPSGCGKTTLLRLIAGFERPQNGHIELAGRIVAGPTDWLPPERRGVGMVFQDYALFPHLDVAQNIAFGLKHRSRFSPPTVKQRVAEAIALVGLEKLEDRYPHELSGGQQQRVAIARALAPCPALMLLDEPLSNLDVQVRHRLRHEIRSILKAAGTSAIFVTHDQEEALSISDVVAVMREGQLEQYGTPEAIYQNPTSRFVADFVTQANFLPARRRGSFWETEIGSFALSLEAVLGTQAADNPDLGELMIRQEDLHLQPDSEGPVVICDRQFLGREYRYYLQTVSGRELIARTLTSTAFPIGQRVQVAVVESALRLFPVLHGHWSAVRVKAESL